MPFNRRRLMKGFDMNKKVVIVGVCVNIFVLVKMNSKLNQTKKSN